MPLVVADRIWQEVPVAAARIRRSLRSERMLGVDQATTLAEELATDEVRRLADACWVRMRPSDMILDPLPYGIDRGISPRPDELPPPSCATRDPRGAQALVYGFSHQGAVVVG